MNNRISALFEVLSTVLRHHLFCCSRNGIFSTVRPPLCLLFMYVTNIFSRPFQSLLKNLLRCKFR